MARLVRATHNPLTVWVARIKRAMTLLMSAMHGIAPEDFGMEYRLLGRSGFKVPVLTFGTGTFGGKGDFFKAWGDTDAKGAERLVDICLDAGLTMFDSADVYSAGAAEEVLGAAIKGRRSKVLISTKYTFRHGEGPNDVGSSRYAITRATEAALKRLGTDHIDLVQLHAFDAQTPPEPAT